MDSIVFLTSLAARFALSRASLLFARLARDSSSFSRALAAASSSAVSRIKRFTLLTRALDGRPEPFAEVRFVIAADPAPDVEGVPRAQTPGRDSGNRSSLRSPAPDVMFGIVVR